MIEPTSWQATRMPGFGVSGTRAQAAVLARSALTTAERARQTERARFGRSSAFKGWALESEVPPTTIPLGRGAPWPSKTTIRGAGKQNSNLERSSRKMRNQKEIPCGFWPVGG
jgi:hypothetical protein